MSLIYNFFYSLKMFIQFFSYFYLKIMDAKFFHFCHSAQFSGALTFAPAHIGEYTLA